MKKTVVIAAAGLGSRLGKGIPKCLVDVAGYPIIKYQLDVFGWADEIRLVVGYRADAVMERVRRILPDVKFFINEDYETTTTLQSNIIGADGESRLMLFIDGDMIVSHKTAEAIRMAYEKGNPFIGVSDDLSSTPVYADVQDGHVHGFSFETVTDYEWANIALVNPVSLPNVPKYFFEGLEHYLPLPVLDVERLEIDTEEDLEVAEGFFVNGGNWG